MEIRVSRRLDLVWGRSWRGRGRAEGCREGQGAASRAGGGRARGLQAGQGARTQPREGAAGHSWEVPGQGEQMSRATPLQHCEKTAKNCPHHGMGAHRGSLLLMGHSAGTWDSSAAPQKAERASTVQPSPLTPFTGQLMPGFRGINYRY